MQTSFVENDQDYDSDNDDKLKQLLVLLIGILQCKYTILSNCYMKTESSIACQIHCFLFFVRTSWILGWFKSLKG